MSLTRVCVAYVVKEVALFRRARSINGRGAIEHALEPYRPAERKLHEAYVENGTNSYLFYLKYIPKVLQGPLKGKESR